MRHILTLILLLATIATAGTISGPGRVRRIPAQPTQTAAPWNAAHLIAAYDFTADGSLADISGNGYTLTSTNGSPVFQNGGLWFTNAPYLRSSKTITGQASNMTLCVKLKTDLLITMAAAGVVLDSQNFASIFGYRSGYDFGTRAYSGNVLQWDLYTDTGSAARSNTLAWVAVSWTNNLVQNYLATGTVDRARVWMTDTSSALTFTNAAIWVGAEPGPNYYMRGYIYKVRLYDYALSSNEVTQLLMPDM